MAKFYGVVGYVDTQETAPGVYTEVATERKYYGDILKNVKRYVSSEYLNDNLTVNNSISIMADAYAYDNFFAIRYVNWMGANWKVTDVEVQRPRLILSLGEVYNGKTPESSD